MVFLSSAAAAGWHTLLGMETQNDLSSCTMIQGKAQPLLEWRGFVVAHDAGAVQLRLSAFLSVFLYLFICLFGFYSINHTQEFESKMPCSQATYLLQAFQNLFPKDCVF